MAAGCRLSALRQSAVPGSPHWSSCLGRPPKSRGRECLHSELFSKCGFGRSSDLRLRRLRLRAECARPGVKRGARRLVLMQLFKIGS